MAAQLRYQNGTPYNITTGFDTTTTACSLIAPGRGRNSALTAAQWDLGGARPTQSASARPAAGGAAGPQQVHGRDRRRPAWRVRRRRKRPTLPVEFYASAQNLTNHNNYIGYSGVLTSPFFGQPTSVLNPRKIELALDSDSEGDAAGKKTPGVVSVAVLAETTPGVFWSYFV